MILTRFGQCLKLVKCNIRTQVQQTFNDTEVTTKSCVSENGATE